jgi:hypothetical protein
LKHSHASVFGAVAVFIVAPLWTTSAVACSVRDLDQLILNAVVTSRAYWVASLLVSVAIIGLEVYKKRWSLILALVVIILAFHPHLTIRPFPMPSCDFVSVQASQIALAVLLAIFGYQIFSLALSRRRAA